MDEMVNVDSISAYCLFSITVGVSAARSLGVMEYVSAR
jgi:hypothetical protein